LAAQSSEPPLAIRPSFTGKLSSLGRKEAQALVIRLGGSSADEVTARTTLVVVGAEGFPGSEKSEKLRRAEDLGVRVVSENDFCRMAGIQPPEDLKQQYYGQRDLLSMYPGLRQDHLRYLQKWGLIRPVMHRTEIYSFTDRCSSARCALILSPHRSATAARFRRARQLTFDSASTRAARIIKLTRAKPKETERMPKT
jgi:hypothetical protein